MHSTLRCLLGLSFLLLPAAGLFAQCDRVGWVASTQPGCGAKIIDLDNGEILRAIGGAGNLIGGQTISFSSEPTGLPGSCPNEGIEVVNLTCISANLPCKADFGYATDPDNSYRLSFQADVYDAQAQICSWDFGDGSTATGATVEHTFPHEGYFTVCLTVMDGNGCADDLCQNVFVSSINPNWCNYDVKVTAIGNTLYGKLYPISGTGGTVSSVQWFNSKTNQVLAQTPEFTYPLTNYGVYNICAQYEITDEDGLTCTTTRCQQLNLPEPGCSNPLLADGTSLCPNLFAPVCGCDGVTYGNECEAMAAGVAGWWAGQCGSGTSCVADMYVEVVSGTPDGGFLVVFHNQSADYYFTQLDFGDGTPLFQGTDWDTVSHFYAESGIYRSNLTAWKNGSNVSSVIKLVVTDALSLVTAPLPNGTDYVMPGDANGDKKANVYDLLNVGVGYNDEGLPRPFANTSWTPQFAPNWNEHTGVGVNYKHLDCDGNGKVDVFDTDPIEQHYAAIDTFVAPPSASHPKVWVQFDQDTIYVNSNNPSPLSISADVMVGHATNPALNLYGLAFALRYPEFVNHNPESLYDGNPFFGSPLNTMFMAKDIYPRRQYDMGFVHRNGTGASGYGRIANVVFEADFIIIVDIIERASNNTVPFTVSVAGLQAVDADGDPIAMDGVVQDTLWIKTVQSVKTLDPALDRAIRLYPNPASDETVLYTGNLAVEKIEAVNGLGQVVRTIAADSDSATRIVVSDWVSGLYTVRVHTAAGIAEKRLLVR